VFGLYAALCRGYSPERVEATCWIPRDQLEQAARLLWESRPVAYYAWSGHEQHATVTQTARAMSLLYALTGPSPRQRQLILPSPPQRRSAAATFPRH
jgi:anaerobic selenocysteine-containing dehydrogenase